MAPMSFSQPNQSLLAGIECLQWLAMNRHPIGTREMGRLMGIDPNRASRLLNSLVLAGIARKTANRKFTVGSAFHVLSAQSLNASGILPVALPPLEELSRLQCTVALGVLWKDRVAYLFHRNSGRSFHESIGALASYPASESSLGLALLAEVPWEKVEQLYAAKPIPHFENLQALQATLEATRRRGFSRIPSRDTYSEAIVIRDGDEAIAAIGLANCPPDLSEEERLGPLRHAAAAIEAGLQRTA